LNRLPHGGEYELTGAHLTSGLAGIVLAAGGATRFGAPKQLAQFQGISLVKRAVRLAAACCPRGVCVVTGAYGDAVRAELAGSRVLLAHNADWSAGLASSIRRGIEALPPHATACLLMLCDQAMIDAPDLQRLVEAWMSVPGRPAAAQYQGALGVPAVFPRHCWRALQALEGDRGARGLLATLDEVTRVPLPSAVFDVDTPADLARLRGE
jgi:CTP:molybdopterin cytidylyltransferase MocA